MPKNRTPVKRAADQFKDVDRVRRKYKTPKARRRMTPAEERHITNMVIVLKLGSYTRTQISSICGISLKQTKGILDNPETQKQLERLREQLPNAAMELLHGFMIEAVQAIADVMRTSDDPKYVLLAAESILDRGGVPKASRQERHNFNKDETPVFGEDFFERLRKASPEVQERAAAMVDELENYLTNQPAITGSR